MPPLALWTAFGGAEAFNTRPLQTRSLSGLQGEKFKLNGPSRGKSLTFTSKIVPTHAPMNYPTLQKVTMAVAALLTSFALSAHAGPAQVSTARHVNGNSQISQPDSSIVVSSVDIHVR